jgi:hypothetical protein
MKDPYGIPEAPPSGGVTRPLLWLLLVISVAGNVVTSSAGGNVIASVAFGVATLGAGAALIVQHHRNRRR